MRKSGNSKNLKKHFTASALILHDRRVLLVKHKKLGVWLYPGGHIEPNETPEEALIREVKEETGLNIKIVAKRDEELSDTENDVRSLYVPYAILCERIKGKHNPHYHIDLIYLCKLDDLVPEDITSSKMELSQIGWFSLEDLSDLKLFPNFRRLLGKILSQRSDST